MMMFIIVGMGLGFMHGLWWLIVTEKGTWRDVWIMTAVGAVYYSTLLAMIFLIIGLWMVAR